MSQHSARSWQYQQLRKRWLASGVHGWVCWMCGRPVDPHARPRSKGAPTVDHLVPTSAGSVSPLDVSNWRLAHHSCNARRKAGAAPSTLERRW